MNHASDPMFLDLIVNHRKTSKSSKSNQPNETDKCLKELLELFKHFALDWCQDASINGNLFEFKAHLQKTLEESVHGFKNR
jgi:hypothetical protein